MEINKKNKMWKQRMKKKEKEGEGEKKRGEGEKKRGEVERRRKKIKIKIERAVQMMHHPLRMPSLAKS